jgi:hypothetical protein
MSEALASPILLRALDFGEGSNCSSSSSSSSTVRDCNVSLLGLCFGFSECCDGDEGTNELEPLPASKFTVSSLASKVNILGSYGWRSKSSSIADLASFRDDAVAHCDKHLITLRSGSWPVPSFAAAAS